MSSCDAQSGAITVFFSERVELVNNTLLGNTGPALWLREANARIEGWAMSNNTIPVCERRRCNGLMGLSWAVGRRVQRGP